MRAFDFASLGGTTVTEISGSPFASQGLAPYSILPLATGDYVYVVNRQVSGSSTGVIAGFSIGLFYFPAAIIMLVAACVGESAVGVTRFDLIDGRDLYASVTLPSIMVGTVGGGTGLPSQKACLEILGLAGPGKAQALAEVCAGLCLAGELSIIGAMCSGDFSRAHRLLARGKQGADDDVVIWTNNYNGKARVFATTLGHNTATVADPRYLDLITRGLLWSVDKLDYKHFKAVK